MKLLRKIFSEIRRVGLETTVILLVLGGALVGAFSLGGNWKVIGYKLFILSAGVLYAHVARQLIFPYVDLKSVIDPSNSDLNEPGWLSEDSQPVVRAAVVLGTYLFMAAIILGFTTGI